MKVIKVTIKVTLFSFIGLLSWQALAEENQSKKEVDEVIRQDNSHFYTGIRMGGVGFDDACGDGSDCDDHNFGYGLYGGYQFASWFAIEGGITDYGKAEASYSGNNQTSADIKGVELSTMFMYRFIDDWSIYTRLGVAYQDIDKQSTWEDDQSSNDWNGVAAIGLDYAFATNWSVRGEYQFIDGIGERDTTQQADMSFASIGLTYHFGQQESDPVVAAAVPVAAEKVIESEEPVSLSPKPVTPPPISIDEASFFAFDSSKINQNSELDELIMLLKQHDEGKVEIIGHTDSTGSKAYNQHLSEERAEAVAEYFVEHGVDASRLKVSGEGKTEPIADNSSKSGRAKNRRVEIKFEDLQEREI